MLLAGGAGRRGGEVQDAHGRWGIGKRERRRNRKRVKGEGNEGRESRVRMKKGRGREQMKRRGMERRR